MCILTCSNMACCCRYWHDLGLSISAGRLKEHSAKMGARGLILLPSRELALQTQKVVQELGRCGKPLSGTRMWG